MNRRTKWLAIAIFLNCQIYFCRSQPLSQDAWIPQLITSEAVEAAQGSSFNTNTLSVATLKLVSIITRHGSRSPGTSFVNDLFPYYDSNFWPDGVGQLTRYGKQQLFKTGRNLRRVYHGFIGINYHRNDTAVTTNPYDRDFMSAACLLAGLYPPAGYQLWNEDILWQPIPIWEEKFDVANLATENVCPTFSAEQNRSLDSLNNETGRYKEVFETLTKYSGQKVETFMEAYAFYDTFQLQWENGYVLPTWVTTIFPEPLTAMASLTANRIFAGTEKLIRLSSGPVLKKVLRQMRSKARGTLTPDRRLFIEAAHDATIVAVFNGLGLNDPFYPGTSAYMAFELHENSQGYLVQVLYYSNSSMTSPTLLNMPACRNPCSLSTFAGLVNQVAPENWVNECHSDDF